jgi:hypothetical protein
MTWLIKRSPFRQDEDPAEHMVNLLSDMAMKAGTPLSDLDRKILGEENPDNEAIPEGLRQRAKQLIVRIFEGEPWDDLERDPKDFGSSLEWASDSRCSNIVMLAEEVACEIAHPLPHLHGWGLVKDKLQLIGCAVLFIVILGASIAAIQALFGWK